jgi:hypothetical protein
LSQKKKKKNQCGEKGGGGYYILVGSVYLKNSEPSVQGIINRIKYGYARTYLPTQRTRQKRAERKKKKTLVLTLGSPPEKGRKKNPGINPGQPAGKGREKKTLVLTLGSPPEKDGKKKSRVLTLGSLSKKGGGKI